jgi:hypothetical protein
MELHNKYVQRFKCCRVDSQCSCYYYVKADIGKKERVLSSAEQNGNLEVVKYFVSQGADHPSSV